MRIYTYDDTIEQHPAHRVTFRAHAGYTLAVGSAAQVLHRADAQTVTVSGGGILRVDTGLTLDEAHAALTNGLTKADLVALGDDFGLTLSDSSLKSELLDAIRAHLEGLAT